MLAGQITLSVILICCGFIVKAFPNTIAGYNTLSKEEKAKINISKLATFLRNVLIGLGLLTFVIYVYLNYLGLEMHYIFLCNALLIIISIVISSVYSNYKFKIDSD